jgi:hypothetical protein
MLGTSVAVSGPPCFRNRVALQDGTFLDDLAMAWFPTEGDGAG